MRWSTVRLIWRRELVDLLRDRRTLLLIFGLPVLLYPGFGLLGFLVALGLLEQRPVVGVVGMEHATAPAGYPALFADGQFAAAWSSFDPASAELAAVEAAAGGLEVRPLASADRGALVRKEVDVLLVIPPDFADRLRAGEKADERPTLELHYREGDDTAKMGRRRVLRALDRWQVALKAARFRQAGLPPHFDEPVRVADPEDAKPPARRIIDELRDGLARAFPFVLFMWVLTGAIQPAIDMGAGEKERGTMETLLISPASRAEIVLGKFLAVSIFASVAGIWNLLFFGGGAVLVGLIWPDFVLMRPAGLFWCAALTPAVACLFAAVCLALGVYAKSTKEGQYYLMPMFLVVVPLIFLSMTPGVDLNLLTSFIPLTGAALLLQKFLAVSSEPPPLAYLAPVLLGLAGWAALALRWAVYQFSREEVLFREAERFELRLWLRSLFRRPEKPAGGG